MKTKKSGCFYLEKEGSIRFFMHFREAVYSSWLL